MKILQVSPYFHPAYAFGGPVKVAYQVSRELVNRGHQIVVYTTDVKNRDSRLNVKPIEIIDGIKVNYLTNFSMMLSKELKLFITPELIFTVKNKIKDSDVIHLHEYRTFQNIVVYHYAKKYDVPYVLQAHGALPRIVSKRRLKLVYDVLFGYKLLRDASQVIALNHIEAEQYMAMGVPEEKIKVVPNGIDLSEYAELPSKGSFKKKYGIPEEKKVILYLGRINRIKGVDFIVKAYAHLIKNMNYQDEVLVIAGPDDGYLQEVKRLAHSTGVSNSILFVGPLYGKDKLEAYIDSNVYVLPSIYEIFGITVLEAYACGKPVVASRVGGLMDLVMDGVTGYLFEPGDVEHIAKHIYSLINDSNLAEGMGLRGKQFVNENFTIEKVTDRLEQLYHKIIVS